MEEISAASSTDADRSPSRDFEPPSIAVGGFETLIFRIVELISLTSLVIITGRLMEPAGRGLYALASLTTMVVLLPLGPVWIGNIIEMTSGRAEVRELFGASIVIAAIGGIVTALVALGVALPLGDRWWVVGLPAAVTPFMLLGHYQEGLLTGLGHLRAVNINRIGNAVLPLVFIAPPLLAGASARTAIAVWTLAWVTIPLVTFFFVRSFVGSPQLPRDRRLYRRVMTYGAKISALNAVDTLKGRVGLVVLAAFATEAAVGVFSIALAAAQVLVLTTSALALSAFRRIGSDSPEASAALTVRTIRHSVLLTTGGCVILIPLVYVAIPWTMGDGYEDVPLLVLLLVPSTMYLAAVLPLYTFFQVQAKKPAKLLEVGGVALLLNVGFTVALAPLWGARGVAAGSSLGGVVAAVLIIRAFRAESGTRLRELLPGRREVEDYVALAASYKQRTGRVGRRP